MKKNIEAKFEVKEYLSYSSIHGNYYLQAKFDNVFSNNNNTLSAIILHSQKGESMNQFLKKTIDFLKCNDSKQIIVEKMEESINKEFEFTGDFDIRKQLEEELSNIKLTFEVNIPEV